MKIRLERFEQTSELTKGKMFIGSEIICYTLEMAWKGNSRDDKTTQENEASCIPEGIYKCKAYSSPKYPNVWEVTGVPGRDKILIHNGNYVSNKSSESHSIGCILVGKNIVIGNGKEMVNDSRNTLQKLRNILPSEFDLEIICVGFSNKLC